MRKLLPLSAFGLTLWLTLTAHAIDRVLIIGIEQYQFAPTQPAPGAIRDANDMERFVQQRMGFPASAIRKLTGAQATTANIKAEMERLISESKPGDRVLVFYSGHGSIALDDDGDESKTEAGDRMDETIVPYDAQRNGAGMIRDDQFARWIAELAGRRIVMIFDSCHSGTISRAVTSVAEENKTARYLAPADSVLEQLPKSRNFNEVSDGLMSDADRVSSQSDVVIISAAGAKQKAHALVDNQKWRGALTVSLMNAYGASAPTLGDLESSLKQQIKQLQAEKRLPGSQVPEFAVSAPRLRLEPLFGSWESVPAIALINPRSKIKVGLTTNDAHRQRNAQGHLVYYDKENISYTISTDTPGFLYLFAFSQDPQTKAYYVTMLLPNQHESMNNEIKPPGLRLPANGEYEISPTGLDVTVALITTKKLALAIKDRYSWEELFGLLNLKAVQQEVAQQMRGVEAKPGKLEWQAASLPIFTTVKK